MSEAHLIRSFTPTNVLFQGFVGRIDGDGVTEFNDATAMMEALGGIAPTNRITRLVAQHGWLVDSLTPTYANEFGGEATFQPPTHGGTGGGQTIANVDHFITRIEVFWGNYSAGASNGVYIARVIVTELGGRVILDTGEPQGFGALNAFTFAAPDNCHIAFLTGATHAPDNYMCGFGVGYLPLPE